MTTIILIVISFKKKIEEYQLICYTPYVVQPTPDTGRRCSNGNHHYFSSDCRSRCGLPPHQQMARQTWEGQQIAWRVLCRYKTIDCRLRQQTYCHEEKKNPSTVRHYGRGIRSFVQMDSSLLLPNGIIAYANSNCKIRFFRKKFILIWYQSIMIF